MNRAQYMLIEGLYAGINKTKERELELLVLLEILVLLELLGISSSNSSCFVSLIPEYNRSISIY